jgi:hypothetical protein
MNAAMGGGENSNGGPGSKESLMSPGGGSWVYTKITQIKRPSDKFVMLDENVNTINDGTFFTDLGSWSSPNFPLTGTFLKDAPEQPSTSRTAIQLFICGGLPRCRMQIPSRFLWALITWI